MVLVPTPLYQAYLSLYSHTDLSFPMHTSYLCNMHISRTYFAHFWGIRDGTENHKSFSFGKYIMQKGRENDKWATPSFVLNTIQTWWCWQSAGPSILCIWTNQGIWLWFLFCFFVWMALLQWEGILWKMFSRAGGYGPFKLIYRNGFICVGVYCWELGFQMYRNISLIPVSVMTEN